MKIKFIWFIMIVLIANFTVITFWQWLQLWSDETILNKDSDNTLNVDNNNNPITNPIREWVYKIIDADSTNTISTDELKWLSNPWMISTHNVALNKTMSIIKSVVNYAISMVSLVALVFLIYHWFLMVTAAWDDAQFKKWNKWIKTAIIAIAGIWLSWLFVSLIFYIIEKMYK